MRHLYFFFTVFTLATSAIFPTNAEDRKHVFKIVPEDRNAYGKTYAEWSAEWWQWALSLPLDEHPLTDTADCNTGQSGDVWFLGGSLNTTEAVRKCKIPFGKAILIPILNAECSDLEGEGNTEERLGTCASAYFDKMTDVPKAPDMDFFVEVTSMYMTVDGKTLTENLSKYRTQSPLYPVKPVANGQLGTDEEGIMVAAGYYILLEPPPVGRYIVSFGGKFDGANINENGDENIETVFELKIVYHLNIF